MRPVQKNVAVLVENSESVAVGRLVPISLGILLALCTAARGHNRLVVDLCIGETQTVTLGDGTNATLTLLGIDSQMDGRGSIKEATARIRVDDATRTLPVGMYNLPAAIGDVLIDCTITKDYCTGGEKRGRNWWNLAFTKKDVEDYGYDYQKDA